MGSQGSVYEIKMFIGLVLLHSQRLNSSGIRSKNSLAELSVTVEIFYPRLFFIYVGNENCASHFGLSKRREKYKKIVCSYFLQHIL